MIENEEKNQTSLPSAHDDLPIGRDTEFILKEWIRVQSDIPKVSRYTVVPILLKTLAVMVSDVYFANALKTERKQHLTNYKKFVLRRQQACSSSERRMAC